MTCCSRLRSLGSTPLLQTLTATLVLLANRWPALEDEIKTLDSMLEKLTMQYAPRLRGRFGVGPQTAAVLVAVAGAILRGSKAKLHWPHSAE